MTAARPDPDPHPFASKWEKILALFDPRIAIRAHDLDAHSQGRITKRVRVSRTWWPNYGQGAGVWTKEYGHVGYDLRSFNRAERDILESLKGLRHCYQLVENLDRGTPLRVDPAEDFGSHIATTHMGPTVYDWQQWPVRVGRDRQKHAHLFCLPGNLVRLALAGLRALDEIHAANLVHMDYRRPNFCLAARQVTLLQDAAGDYLKIELDWQVLKSIDFGFSIARGKTPHTLLPQLADATPAAQALIEEVENLGRQQFELLSIAERRSLVSEPVDAVQFADVQHKHTFWNRYCPGALDRLRRIDWREDGYQFGRQLQDLRQRSGWQEFKATHPHAPEKLCTAIDELPEKLVDLGREVGAYPAWDDDAEREFAQGRRDFIQRAIRHLEQTLAELPPEWLADEVLIRREDIEPGQRRPAGKTTPKRKEASASSANPLTDVPARRRVPDFLRTWSWKPVVVGSIAGAALFLAALPSLQEWIHPRRAALPPLVTPEPTPAPAPAPAPAPVAADDPAIACWRDGAWQAGCAFAAYPGGPQFRIVGGDLSFTMGTRQGSDAMAFDNEHPPHPVRFQRRFALAETEVSVAHYLACVQAGGGCREPAWREGIVPYYYQKVDAHQPTSPITGVDWNDARAYAAWLTKKTRQTYALPTEAQWEYAARGNKSARWYFGSDESRLKEEAWYDANSGSRLHPVGSTPRNRHPWGLKDMAGNAWEWVADCWHENYENAPDNGDRAWEGENGGDCGRRVVRGGSWFIFAWNTRAAVRGRFTTDFRFGDVSFRPARMLP